MMGQPPMGPPPVLEPLGLDLTKPLPKKPDKTPLESIPEHQRHSLERIALGVSAEIHHRRELVRAYLLGSSGRPPFTIALTAAEKQQRFNDPAVRQKILEDILAEQGPAAVRREIDRRIKGASGG